MMAREPKVHMKRWMRFEVPENTVSIEDVNRGTINKHLVFIDEDILKEIIEQYAEQKEAQPTDGRS